MTATNILPSSTELGVKAMAEQIEQRCECACRCFKPLTDVEVDYYEKHPDERQKLCGNCYYEMKNRR